MSDDKGSQHFTVSVVQRYQHDGYQNLDVANFKEVDFQLPWDMKMFFFFQEYLGH